MFKQLNAFISSVRPEFESKLREWVEIPTISAQPDHRADILRGAHAASDYMRSLGASTFVADTPGNPVVVGRFASSDTHPTLTIYNHFDVQPADEPQWTTDPFSFRRDGDRYFGRGTTDDKGPALTALIAAGYAHQQKVPLNIQFIWELEEEIGSPNFEFFMKKYRSELKSDSVVVSDTIWISRKLPAVAYGLRGLLPLRIRLRTGTKDVHSGLTGGAARNPIGELCCLIAECHDASTGKVHVPGFYDDVVPPSRAELASFLRSGFNVKHFKRAHELLRLRSDSPQEVVKRIWGMPTFEVHGIVGGYTGPGVKTAIAPFAEAKVSMRLVPNQHPARILRMVRAFLRRKNPDVEVLPESGLEPFLGPSSGPYADAASDAMKYAFGRSPAFVREGGSIGAVVTMQKYLKCPILFLGLSLPEHGYHAPNENFDWQQASGGIRMFVRYFDGVSRLER